jgi:hypothetical protein
LHGRYPSPQGRGRVHGACRAAAHTPRADACVIGPTRVVGGRPDLSCATCSRPCRPNRGPFGLRGVLEVDHAGILAAWRVGRGAVCSSLGKHSRPSTHEARSFPDGGSRKTRTGRPLTRPASRRDPSWQSRWEADTTHSPRLPPPSNAVGIGAGPGHLVRDRGMLASGNATRSGSEVSYPGRPGAKHRSPRGRERPGAIDTGTGPPVRDPSEKATPRRWRSPD